MVQKSFGWTVEARLLEHSRTAGILEGKIIACSEENKAGPAAGESKSLALWKGPKRLEMLM